MSEDEFLEPYYDPARREAMRQSMVAEGFLADLPLESLSDTERMQIDNRLMIENVAKADGISVDQLLDNWEAEKATAKSFDSVEEAMAWLNKDETSQHDALSVGNCTSSSTNVRTYPTGKYTKLIAAVNAERAMRAIFGVPDLPRDDECIFDVLEREAQEASVAKYIADEHGTLEGLEAAIDAEFAGQQGRTVEEMMTYLFDYAASHDD